MSAADAPPPAADVDLMNDPHDADHAPQPSAYAEPDHCRICRSEGSDEEPLFHPCKCSGSIKFVHQDCLMEWLQHSQKKYCELCKTPFAFTKVYDPAMPSTIPTPLFLRRIARHMLQNALMWARGALVALIWLGWLPWMVRWMWRAWFWFSDGGWFSMDLDGSSASRSQQSTASQTTATVSPTSPSLPFVVLSFLRSYGLSPLSSPVNGGPVVELPPSPSNNTGHYPDGIFFDSNPFAQLTRYAMANRLIVDILEGQLLTALIVVSFILVFLIREWVVQQQPDLRLGEEGVAELMDLQQDRRRRAAPQNDDALEEEARLAEEAEEEELVGEEDVEAGVDEAILDRAYGPVQGEDQDENAGEPALGDIAQRAIAQPRRRRVFPANAQSVDVAPANTQATEDSAEASPHNEDLEGRSGTGSAASFTFGDSRAQRPQPTRESTSQVTDFRRHMEESGGIGGTSDFNFTPPSIPFPSSAGAGFAWDTNAEDFSDQVASEWTVVDSRPSSAGPVNARASDGEHSTPRGSVSLPASDRPSSEPSTAEASATASARAFNWTPPAHFDRLFGGAGRAPEELDSQDDKGKEKECQEAPESDQSEREHHDQESESGASQSSSGIGGSEWSTAAQAGDPPVIVDRSESPTPPATPGTAVPELPAETPIEASLGAPAEAPVEAPAEVPADIPAGDIPELPDRPQPPEDPVLDEHLRPEERIQRLLDRVAPQAPVPAAPVNAPRRNAPFGFWPFDADEPVPGNDAPAAGDADVVPINDMADRQRQLEQDIADREQAIAEREEEVARLEGMIADEDGADDFEGIMELVGMRGPLIGLVQNAAISSVLITATVAIGVVFPYVAGKTVMLVLAHPVLFFIKLPILVISFFAEFFVDSITFLAFSFLLMFDQAVKFVLDRLAYIIPGLSKISVGAAITRFLQNWATDGQNRIVAKLVGLEATYLGMRRRGPVHPPFSVLARECLANVCRAGVWAFGLVRTQYSKYLASGVATAAQKVQQVGLNVPNPVTYVSTTLEKSFGSLNATGYNITSPSALLSAVTSGGGQQLVDPPEIYQWSTWDKVAVVILGYASFTIAGAMYLRARRAIATGQVEKFAIEFLEQCGGVMKVVLIIGIEMFVFPLYCGILLDVAMLPLFEGATITSRVLFALEFPLTAIFVHWFVGTCYMFHFALFVSMCRKIMRAGVLYFIRDPDDPTFHPVRDVLDRPVVTQLRKIGFSAFIYGVLVIVCLGGVVWTLAMATISVLPVHWSSNEPVLEFPVDLLFYNFLMPVAVKFFKPSDGLQSMYDWWFRWCARMLRLSSFMFDERNADEEGYHYRRTWKAWLLGAKGDVEQPILDDKAAAEAVGDVYFRRNGRFVRAPASDSVRRPKGSSVFIPVDQDNHRLDGADDPPDGPYGAESPNYRLVYLPPMFRTRIGFVVLGIWVFAAVTGVSVTIGPLLLGRAVLKSLVPTETKLNDIYALSIGLYIVGGIAIVASKLPVAIAFVRRAFAPPAAPAAPPSKLHAITAWTVRAAKLSYMFTSFAIVLPTLVALMIEFYVIIPIHTYFLGDEQHVVHFIQDWTLGVLYIKMMGRMALLDAESRWARSLRDVVARGYLDPDVKLATKEFIAPAGGFMLAALVLPLGLAFTAVKLFLHNAEDIVRSRMYRYAYPAVFAVGCVACAIYGAYLLVERWRRSVRDEVYLIGERLHNHGEDHPPPLLAGHEAGAGGGIEGPREVGGVEA